MAVQAEESFRGDGGGGGLFYSVAVQHRDRPLTQADLSSKVSLVCRVHIRVCVGGGGDLGGRRHHSTVKLYMSNPPAHMCPI